MDSRGFAPLDAPPAGGKSGRRARPPPPSDAESFDDFDASEDLEPMTEDETKEAGRRFWALHPLEEAERVGVLDFCAARAEERRRERTADEVELELSADFAFLHDRFVWLYRGIQALALVILIQSAASPVDYFV